MKFNIDGRDIGHGCPPYIIAELSGNHNGSLERALKTIEAAKECGADAIKLQTYTADTLTIDCDGEDFKVNGGLWDGYKLYDLYRWAETPFEWHKAMFEHARRIGITVFSTPFDESAVDLLKSLDAPAFKIASFEIGDIPLIQYAAKLGKPMILSTGTASEEEINDAANALEEVGCKNYMFLHCISSYPAPVEEANLRHMVALSEKLGTLPGLSDHTLGTTVAITSVALGACLIEKHFTLNRKDKGPDSEFSLEPDELRHLCQSTKEAWEALGKVGFQRQKSESGSRVFKRSIYFVRDLPAGAIVTESDIRRIRPGMGLAPKYFDQVLGKTLKTAVKRGTATTWQLFE